MLVQILLAAIAGTAAGTFTGLIPGVHINLVALLLVAISTFLLQYTSVTPLLVFIVCMGVVHTFLDSIPSIFLGAPDADQVLNVLPGHKLLLEGKGFEAVKLTVIGSLFCLIATIAIIPLLIPFVPIIYTYVQPFMGYILLSVVLFMILKEPSLYNKTWSAIVFLLSGILGILVFSFHSLKQPLLPMLSGLFGISMLIMSLFERVQLPKQKISEDIIVPKKDIAKALGAGTFSGSLTGIFPGLGAAQAAIIGSQLTGNLGVYGFIVLVGGINTVNFVFSLVTLYTLEKARNGAVVAIMQIAQMIDLNQLIVLLAAALLAGGIATLLALRIARIFSNFITKVNYPLLCICVISFVTVLVLFFSGFFGLLILLISTTIGMIAPLKGIGRNHAMGCLLLPVIFYFLL